ncbi:putative PurR-regulated permease PerM [Oceanihabitans sediminis]|uniref:AI-2E family transporter n=1 Tax=Oceanihabitans sediminis TaxID=1812012 RepID=A0A368P429_9FLAO|nr:AI-2E family transporter [Oceanihabitans sediminis]MDX1773437.1 AI-2E family transporter [Oceanihabitans sediminis]RBP32892.1 putative PurR-regulated permease PerM [Oceanihabitans sediminis]RCU57582.1 AI-2E family transporter [Oceanihabitans sediminis]
MTSNQISNGILKAIGIILGIALLLYFLFKIQSVIVYIAIASVISLIGRPIILFLRRRLKFKNTIAVIVTMLLFMGLIFSLIRLFVPLIIEQGNNLALLDMEKLQSNMEVLHRELLAYFQINNIDVQQSIKDSELLSKIDYSLIPNFLNSLVSGLGNFSIGLFSVLFISFFFLKDSKLLENGMMTVVPEGNESRWQKSSAKIKDLLSRYFVGLIFQILILFIIYSIGLTIIGVQNAIVIAFLCALLNLIPYVGPLIGAVLMILLTMTSSLGQSFTEVILPKSLWVFVVIAIGQLFDNFISQPVIFSKSVKSHPIEIFLIILIAGILFGVVGLIVAIPAYTAIKVILKEFLSDNKIVKKLTKNL